VHRAALIEWAHAVGYTRVWFDGELVDIEPTAGGPVETRCTGCGQRFIDGRSPRFWYQVHCSGAFPIACSLCGSDLEQWTPVRCADSSAAALNVVATARSGGAATRANRR
jgi:hypothetical protein